MSEEVIFRVAFIKDVRKLSTAIYFKALFHVVKMTTLFTLYKHAYAIHFKYKIR